MPEFTNKKEWFNEAKRLRATGLSAPDVAKKLGTFQVDGNTYAIHNKGADGVTSVNMEGRKARGNRRNLAIKEQDTKLLETLKIGGMGETEAQSVLEREKAGYKRIEHQAAELNKVHGKGAFNAGHETAALEGGGNYGRNARVEIGKSRIKADGTKLRGNQSRGRLDETRDSVKSVMGIPRSHRGGEDTALFNLLEKDTPGIMDLGLTPKDRQDIKRTKTNAQADDIIANRQTKLQINPKPKPNRKALKALAVAGLAAPSVVGTAASAAETKGRTELAVNSKNVMDWVQAGLSGVSLIADFIPGIGELISSPADLANLTIDGHREPKTVKSQVQALNKIKLNR